MVFLSCNIKYTYVYKYISFPGGTIVKNLPTDAGDTRDAGSIPGSARSLGKLYYYCLGKPMDREAWQATVHRSQRVGHSWAPPPSLISCLFSVGEGQMVFSIIYNIYIYMIYIYIYIYHIYLFKFSQYLHPHVNYDDLKVSNAFIFHQPPIMKISNIQQR